MSVLEHSVYLDSYLAPLARWLAEPDVTDIFVNKPQEVWVERLGGDIACHEAPGLTRESLGRLARQIAALNSQGVSREHPLLAASLPDGSRVQVVLPPATRGEIAIAIRRHVVGALSLEDYAEQGAFEGVELSELKPREQSASTMARGEGALPLLRQAVREKRNVLISGGTSSGKTTFLNALLREVPAQERLILIEDTPELQVSHANYVGLLAARGEQGEAAIDAEDLLIAALRMRPDRIILGEMRGREALTFLRAINTGHPGSMSTIHADSPQGALDQLALLIVQSGSSMAWDTVLAYAARSVDVIVQLQRKNGRREIMAMASR